MKKKINIWNTPLRSPTPEAEQYARRYYRQRRKPEPKIKQERVEQKTQENAPVETSKKELETKALEIENEKEAIESKDSKPEVVKRYKVLKRHQRRRQAMSISVSEEEEELLRAGAAADGMTFSAWARKVLFRAMKTRIPDRPE